MVIDRETYDVKLGFLIKIMNFFVSKIFTLRFSRFRTFFSTTWRAWPSGPSPQRLESPTEVAMDDVDDTWTSCPELGTFAIIDADGMLLMLAMEQYTRTDHDSIIWMQNSISIDSNAKQIISRASTES